MQNNNHSVSVNQIRFKKRFRKKRGQIKKDSVNQAGSYVITCKLIKIVTTLGCVLGFQINSYVIFKEYIEGKTLLSSNLETSPTGSLMAPGILICGSISF